MSQHSQSVISQVFTNMRLRKPFREYDDLELDCAEQIFERKTNGKYWAHFQSLLRLVRAELLARKLVKE